MNKIIILIGIILLSACQHSPIAKVNNTAKNVITIEPKKFDIKEGLMAKYIDTMIYIPLETNDTVICGQIQQLHRYNHKFYLFDRTTSVIFIFDEKGRFIKKIANKGRGPQEYVRIDNYAFDKNSGNSYIFCGRSQKILEYNEWGELTRTIPCKFIISSFDVLSSNTFLLYGGTFPNETVFHETYPEQDRLAIFNVTNNEYDPLGLNWKYDENYITPGMDKNFFHCEDTISFIEKFGNFVYRFNTLNNQLECHYYIDFGKYNLLYDFNTPSKQFKKLASNSKSKAKISHILENKNIVYIHYSFEGLMFNSLYYKDQKQTLNIGPAWINENDGVSMPSFFSVDNNYFIGISEVSVLRNIWENPKNRLSQNLKNLIAHMQETDNPCIVIVKFKNNI